ncbi:MAG: type III-A CRISPR-associated protein Csm2 [Archaeoglobaceae archaeon]
MSLNELIEILESEAITDFGEVGKKWEKAIKSENKKDLKNRLKDVAEKRIELIKRERLKFLDSDPNRVLTVALLIAGFSRANDLKRSQIRKILDIMQNTKKKGKLGGVSSESVKKEVARIRYLLAYTSGRNSSVKLLQSAIDPLLAEIRNYEDFEKVYEFFQSVVAFHYFLGGD